MPDEIVELLSKVVVTGATNTTVNKGYGVVGVHNPMTTGPFAAYICEKQKSSQWTSGSYVMIGTEIKSNPDQVFDMVQFVGNDPKEASQFRLFAKSVEQPVKEYQPYHFACIYDSMDAVALVVNSDLAPLAEAQNVVATTTFNERDFLFNKLTELQNTNKFDSALDFQFSTVENWLVKGKIHLCEEFLNDSRVDSLNTELLTALLVVTKPWKNIIKSRASFSIKVKELLTKRDATQAAKNLVARLI